TLYTVGHGRRSADELIAILHEARIERLVDIRAFPASRRNPQFAKGRLAATLQSHRIAYDWQGKGLGGFRKGGEASAHSALRHPMFRPTRNTWKATNLDSARLRDVRRVIHLLDEAKPREHVLN